MAEVQNAYYSSVFTTKDISSLPVTKFDHYGQLFVTPEMIAKKIKNMKDHKSLGVDGIPPKLLKEIVTNSRRNSSFRTERSKHYTVI